MRQSSGSDEISVTQRNANIRNLFAPSPAALAKRKAARQRSQSTVCLERGQSEQEPRAGQAEREPQDGRALSLSNLQLPRSMGHISAYNGNNKNNADYHPSSSRRARQGSVSPDLNQLAMTKNQSAIRQYNAVNGNSLRHEFHQDVAYVSNKDSPYASGDLTNSDNNGMQQSAVHLPPGLQQVEQSTEDSPGRLPLTWHQRRHWPAAKHSENLINSNMQKQQQQLPQDSLELKLPGIWQNNNVDFGNEITWGAARETSLPLSQLEMLHDSLSLDKPQGELYSVGAAAAAAEADAEKLWSQPQSMQRER